MRPLAEFGRSTILAHFAGWQARYAFDALPQDVVALACQCFMDLVAVAIAAVDEPLVAILRDDLCEDGAGTATLLGHHARASVLDAILINGAAGHALDYDDGNPSVMGHATVAIAPAIFALAERHSQSGRDMIAAFVAGYEMAARVGTTMGPRHYQAGFHGTATIGSFGAAGGSACLLGLDDAQMAHALALTGTRSAGLRASFGTMAKPLHPAHAAWVGATAARWAARGFTGATDIFADDRGFAATHAGRDKPVVIDPERFFIRDNAFKWHAACYLTHGVIDAATALRREHRLAAGDIAAVVLRVPPSVRGVCDIGLPNSGLEVKFSLPMVAAFALSGVDTANPDSFSDARALDASLRALCAKAEVRIDEALPSGGEVTVRLRDGRELTGFADPITVPVTVAEQGLALAGKFDALVAPRLGNSATAALREAIAGLAGVTDARDLGSLARPA